MKVCHFFERSNKKIKIWGNKRKTGQTLFICCTFVSFDIHYLLLILSILLRQSESLSFRSNQRALCYEEFLHAKVNNKDVYVDHGATEDIPEYAYSFRRQYMDGDLTALN